MTKEEAIYRLKNTAWLGTDKDSEETVQAVDMAIEALQAEPVKHGEWVEKTVSDEKVIDEWQSARCSVCGKYHTTPYMYYFDNFTYCPNCGAKMDKK